MDIFDAAKCIAMEKDCDTVPSVKNPNSIRQISYFIVFDKWAAA